MVSYCTADSLSARLAHLKVVAALWSGGGGPAKAVLHALDMDDLSRAATHQEGSRRWQALVALAV